MTSHYNVESQFEGRVVGLAGREILAFKAWWAWLKITSEAERCP